MNKINSIFLLLVGSCGVLLGGCDKSEMPLDGGDELTSNSYFRYYRAAHREVVIRWYWTEGNEVKQDSDDIGSRDRHLCDFLKGGECNLDETTLRYDTAQEYIFKRNSGEAVNHNVIFAADSVDMYYLRPTCKVRVRYRRGDNQEGNPMKESSYRKELRNGVTNYRYVVRDDVFTKLGEVDVPTEPKNSDLGKAGDLIPPHRPTPFYEICSRYTNATDKPLKIEYSALVALFAEEGDKRRLVDRTYTVTIAPGETLEQIYNPSKKGGLECLISDADRATFTFGDERKIEYRYGDGQYHNPLAGICELNDDCMKIENSKVYEYIEIFRFSDLHYNMAKPIK